MTQFSTLYGARLDRELASADRSELFTTANRKSAINEAQEQFAELTECLTRTVTSSLTGGVSEYDVNSTTFIPGGDFIRFSQEQVQFRYTDASSDVTVLAGDDLPRRDVDWLNRYEPGWQISTVSSTLQQMPAVWYDRKDGAARYLGFWPTPSTGSSASMTAVVPYVAKPSPMVNDTSEPYTVNSSVRTDLRVYHQALVHFAAHQLEKLRKDDQASDRQLQMFISYVTRYLSNKRPKGGSMLTFAKNYFRRQSTFGAEDPRR